MQKVSTEPQLTQRSGAALAERMSGVERLADGHGGGARNLLSTALVLNLGLGMTVMVGEIS